MSTRYDAIVVGAGVNGLTAAAYLAREGRKVLVVEKRGLVGGLAAGEEFHPGYRTAGLLHDTAGLRPWVVEELGLRRHGLRLREGEAPVFAPQPPGRGSGLLLWRDPDKAQKEVSGFSTVDAERYRDYRAFLDRIAPFFRRLLDRVPPDLQAMGLADLWDLGKTALRLRLLGKKDMMEILRIAPMCVADWLGEWFETDLLKALLAAPAIHGSYTGPWSPGTNANLLLAEATRGRAVKGGPRALAAALEGAARAAGVEIRTGATVARLTLEGGGVGGVALDDGELIEAGKVAASCGPKHLFLDLVPTNYLSNKLRRNVINFRTRGTTAAIHLAVSAYPEIACRPDLRPRVIRTGEGLDAQERAFDTVKYRHFSTRPLLEISVPSLDSPELAPEGHHVLSILAHFAPYDLEGGWSDEQREGLYQTVVAALEEIAPGVRETVLGHEVLSPVDLEARYGLSGGQIHHGEHALDQLVIRPTPECARYDTPIEGLYLCGGGSHPGGGLTCAPGALAARRILSR